MAIQFPPAEAGPSTPLMGRTPAYKLSHSLAGHARSVTALQFSPDGRTLVSAGINDISISPDGLYVATASDDTTTVIHTLYPSSSTTATSGSSTSVPTPLRLLAAHTAPVLAVSFSPKSNLLATGSFDESAIVWDVRRGKALRTIPAHADAIWTVGWDPEGVMVVTGSADGLIRLWDANSGQCLKTLDNDTNSPVSYAAFTPSSFFLLSSTLSSALRVYNIHTGKVLKTLRHAGYVSERHPCPAAVFAAPEPASLSGLGPVLDGNTEAAQHANADGEGTAEKDEDKANDTPMDVDAEVNAEVKVDVRVDVDVDVNGAAVAKREAWVVSGSENGKVVIWELGSRRVIQVLEGTGTEAHQRPVVALAVHPDGRSIATGSLEPEKVIHIWRDVQT
ncbi:hypothetical protein JCM24511_06906 [Saitozyma sp. JCM 24511]|nr:hypothetical protein JCM24511_06906 [Saitozyma sp. JCM 24511]